MEAYISGTAGMAAIIKGANAELYQVDKADSIAMKSEVAHRILSSNNDVVFLGNTDKANVLKKLNSETNKTQSLMVFLTILDSAVEKESRNALALHLEDVFLKDIKSYNYVCNVMFARPLPDNSIKFIPGDTIPENSKVFCLLNSLFLCQPKIKEYSNIFMSICKNRGLNSNQSSYVEGLLVNEEFFYRISSQQADINFLNKVHFLLISKLKNTDIVDYIHFSSCIKTEFKPLVNSKVTVTVDHTIYQNKEDIYHEDIYHEDVHQDKVKKHSNIEAYRRVQRELASIKTQLREEAIPTAKRMADELISHQIQDGNNEYAAQSLCQLSEYAKNLNLFEIQLEWALRATEVAPLDYRTFGHAADAYLNLENILDAESAFKLCINSHGDSRVYGLTGLSRIERSRYNLATALDYIEDAIRECGNDHVPYLIKAELLRDQHKYTESEEVYDFVCRNYPEFVIPQCGKAAVLAEQKKFEEAEAMYKLALKNYPEIDDKRYILTGLGFLIARLGRFQESHKFLDESISLATFEDIVPAISKAKVLQMEGRFKDSETLLMSLLNGRAQFVDVVEQLLELYLQTNELKKAQSLYDSATTKIREFDSIQIRYSQLLRKQNKFKDALVVIDKIRAMKPRHTIAMNERAAIFKIQGRYNKARQQYREILNINRFDRRASFGLQAINHIFKKAINIDSVIATANTLAPKTIEDYQTIGNIGLLKLATGDVKEGKKLLLKSYNCEFKSLKIRFNTGLSLASLMLRQTNAALKPIKKPLSTVASIQRTLVYCVQGKKDRVEGDLRQLSSVTTPPFANRIIEMINKKYLSAANDESITQDDIFQEQLKNMLIAA
jgi:tetratricopeptide (TPR) repeat protein